MSKINIALLFQQTLSNLRSHLGNGLILLFLALIWIVYASGSLPQTHLAAFNKLYADSVFLAIILITIAQQLKKPGSTVDPIYWLLLGTAFGTWFVLTILRITIFEQLTNSTQELITELGYFLYFSLTIAAIEVKSYGTADQLLSQQSLLIWISTFIFALGAFVFLALTPTNFVGDQSTHFPSDFVFYILMDIYLLLRWWYLAWNTRHNLWISYFLFGTASLNWAIADLVEALTLSDAIEINSGAWTDWLWYTPYLFVYFALHSNVGAAQEQINNPNFSRSHLYNSPLFFSITCLLLFLLLTSNEGMFTPLNNSQHFIFNLWLWLSLTLAVLQLGLLIRRERFNKMQLAEATISLTSMQQRMQQQAQILEDQSASNKAILETTDNAIFTLNLRGEILSCNPAACSLLGTKEEDLLGNAFIDAVQAEGELVRFFSYQSYRQKLASHSRGVEIESTISRLDNQKIPVHVTLSQEKNNNEGLLVVSLVNISEQKQAEHEAHQLKDQFTANISHEFRTPLTIINGVLDNLLVQEKYQDDQEQLTTAKRNGLRMVRMVEQLLELSRIANDPIPLSALNPYPIAKFVCHSFEEIAQNNQIDFHCQLHETPWITGNPQAFEKILFNLLSNAFKYTKKGKVEVSFMEQGEKIALVVSDTGIGIVEEQQALIFERFHRVENQATHAIHGVGIGLALVKELCDAMHWDLKLDSTPGVGSQFSLYLPKSEQHDIKEKDGEIAISSSNLSKTIESEVIDTRSRISTTTAQKSKYSILIVEDNLDMQAHINEILSPFHQCLLANNGEEGVRLAIDYIPDIIISDIMMPGISGFELLKTLKKTEITTHIPIILLTARSDPASMIRGLEAEADDYLSKPFDAKELLLRINNQLNSREKLQQKLNSRWQKTTPKQDPKPPLEDKFVQKLEQTYAENYQNADFSVLDLADQMAMSDRQVQRKIKAILGISPLEALKQFRLKKAIKQLESGDQIGVVAQTCGFSSQSYFGRCFKEKFNMTPKAFQQSLQ